MGGTVERKGFDLVLNAYASAFNADDPVCLVVKEHGADTSYLGRTAGEWVRDFRSTPGRPEVLYLEGHLPEEGLAAVYRACDCLVAPYRGEGFSLPALEAMACGLPVVHTAAGPVPEFCGPDCGWPIPATHKPVSRADFGPFAPARDPSGFEPDPASLRAAMRDAFERPDESRRRGRNAALAARSMTWARSAAVAESRLAALVAGIAGGGVPRRFVRPVRASPYRPTVSLTMIVRDEEANIRDCLASAAGLFDQIVVVDTGSRDRTAGIAAEMGAEVYRTDWPDHFALARNAALDRATGEWVFWLDADDRLPEATRDALKELFAGLEDEGVAWAMKCRCLSAGAGGEVVVDHVRLFRNDPRVRWRYRVHEQILPSVRAAGGSVRWLAAEVVHLGYRDPAARRGKLERDIRLLSMESLERPGDPFSLFNAAQVLHELGRVGEAAAAYRASLAGSDPRDSIVRKARAGLTQCLRDLGRTADALAECRAGREVYPDDAELLFAEALLARDLGDAEGSVALLGELASGGEGPHFASVDPGLRTTRARHELAVGLWGLGRREEAVGNWEAAVGHNPRFLPAWAGLAGALLAAGAGEKERAGAALAAMRSLAEPGPTEADVLESSSLSASGRHREAAAMLSGASARAPRSGAIRRLLGIALLAASDVGRARVELLEALRLDPTDREAFEAVRGLVG